MRALYAGVWKASRVLSIWPPKRALGSYHRSMAELKQRGLLHGSK